MHGAAPAGGHRRQPTRRALRAGQRGRAGALGRHGDREGARRDRRRVHRPGGGRRARGARPEPARGAHGAAHHGQALDARGGGQVRGPVRVQGRGVPPRRQGEARGRRRRRTRRRRGTGGRRRFARRPRGGRRRRGRALGALRRAAHHPRPEAPGWDRRGPHLRRFRRGHRAAVRLRRRRRRGVPGARRRLGGAVADARGARGARARVRRALRTRRAGRQIRSALRVPAFLLQPRVRAEGPASRGELGVLGVQPRRVRVRGRLRALHGGVLGGRGGRRYR